MWHLFLGFLYNVVIWVSSGIVLAIVLAVLCLATDNYIYAEGFQNDRRRETLLFCTLFGAMGLAACPLALFSVIAYALRYYFLSVWTPLIAYFTLAIAAFAWLQKTGLNIRLLDEVEGRA